MDTQGGESFLTRFPEGRATTDLDLIRITGGNPERMEIDYNAALTRNHGDHLRFEWRGNKPSGAGRGIKVFHDVFLGDWGCRAHATEHHLIPNREIDGYPIETTHWVGEETRFPPRSLFAFAGVGDPSHIRILTLDGFLRQKIAAMYTYDKEAGKLPARCNDLVDLTMVALNTSWDGPRTHAILREEFELRWAQNDGYSARDVLEPEPSMGRTVCEIRRINPWPAIHAIRRSVAATQKILRPPVDPKPPNADWDHHAPEVDTKGNCQGRHTTCRNF